MIFYPKAQSIRCLLLFLTFSLFVSCNQNKTSTSVFAAQVPTECEAKTIKNKYIVRWSDGSYSTETTDAHMSDEDFRKEFVNKHLDRIEHVDRDYFVEIQQNQITLSNQYEITEENTALNWGPQKIQAPELWSQGYFGQNIKVAVVDGMVDQNHIQLKNNIIFNEQVNNEVNDPTRNVHGTHVAGIIAADPDSGGPITGVAYKAQIIGSQFITNQGGGSLGDAIMALQNVAKQGAQIINISWGGAPCVDNLRQALSDLSNQGILLVTASGNEGANMDTQPNYPSAFKMLNQINVAATDINDFFALFSNRGLRSVNIAAPGVNIYSTLPENNYGTMDGTSMAAPMISGAAALLWSAEPNAKSQDIKKALLQSVDRYDNYQVSSYGRVNVKNALIKLREILSSQ